MRRVLVTGASGFVGRALMPALASAGVDPVGVSLRGAAGKTWRAAMAGADAVVHLAARVHVMEDEGTGAWELYRRANVELTREVAQAAAREGVRRVIFVSTVKVNGEATHGVPFRESDPPQPIGAYARSKWEAEQALFEISAGTGLEVVVIRPTLVYGPGVRGNMERLLRLCRRGMPLPLGAVQNRRSLIYVGNLVDAIRTCLDHPGAAGETFLVSDGEDISTPELIRRIAQALGTSARLLPVPELLLRTAGHLLGRSAVIDRLLGSLTVDTAKIQGKIGWMPPHSMSAGLGETAASFLAAERGRHAGR